jgi:hypothetical protein
MKKIYLFILFAIVIAIIVFVLLKFVFLKEGFSNSYKLKVWQTSSVNYNNVMYPELCYDKYKNATKGLAISGGGSRSYSSSIGYMRALIKLGLAKNIDYVSTVSGGSWFYGTYSAAKTRGFTDEQLLGKSVELSTMSEYSLDNTNYINGNKYFMGKRVSDDADFIKYTIQALIPFNGIPQYDWYSYVVGKIFLDPYNLNGDIPITLNDDFANDIKNLNGVNIDVIRFKNTDPFWICNSTLLMNQASSLNNVNIQYPIVVVSFTPMYSGILQKYKLNDGTEIGGYAVETYGFGCDPPNNLNPNDYNNMDYKIFCSNNPKVYSVPNTKNRCFSLRDMLGSSSSAVAGIIYNFSSKIPFLDINLLNPSFKIWQTNLLKDTTSDDQCSYNILKEGDCSAQTGFNRDSCTRYLGKCYSTSANQCKSNNDCSYSFSKRECINNKGGSSLKCRAGFFSCKCDTSPTNYKHNNFSPKLAQITDGAFSDNLGVLPLLARGIKKIVCLNNTFVRVFDDNGNWLKTDGEPACEPTIRNLFGDSEFRDCDTYDYAKSTLQVFKSSEYQYIYADLRRSFMAGGPTFARRKLQVLPNILNGIAGNYEVDILFILLQPSTRFLNELPPPIRNSIIEENKIGINSLKFKFANFPGYSTVLPNLYTGMIQLTNTQVNLLSTFTEWCMLHPSLRPHVIELLS